MTKSSIVLSLAILATFVHLASSQTCDFWICNPSICTDCIKCGRASMIGVFQTTTVICPINSSFCFTAIYDSAHISCKVQKCDSCTGTTDDTCTGCAPYTAPQVVNACNNQSCYALNYSVTVKETSPQTTVEPATSGGSSGNTGTGTTGSDPGKTIPVDTPPATDGGPNTIPTPPPDATPPPTDGGSADGCYILGNPPVAVTETAETVPGFGSAGKPADAGGSTSGGVSTTNSDTAGSAEPGTNTATPVCSAPGSGGGDATVGSGTVSVGSGGTATGSSSGPVSVTEPSSGTGGGQSGNSGTASAASGSSTSAPLGSDSGNFQSSPTVTSTNPGSSTVASSAPDSATTNTSTNDTKTNTTGTTGDNTTTSNVGGNENSSSTANDNTTTNSTGTGQTSTNFGNGQNLTFPVLSGVYLQTGIVFSTLIVVLSVY